MEQTRKDLASVLLRMLAPFFTAACRRASSADISIEHLLLLRHVATCEKPIGPTQMATWLGITPAAATGAVDRLVRLGYLRREVADDRRRRPIALTELGRALVDGFWAAAESAIADQIADVPNPGLVLSHLRATEPQAEAA